MGTVHSDQRTAPSHGHDCGARPGAAPGLGGDTQLGLDQMSGGMSVGGTHLHLYREGYEDKWAYPVDRNRFRNPGNIWQAFEDFCQYCNIRGVPPFEEALL